MSEKDLISMEDRLHYMFDTYFEMYELPFVEFIFQLKENGNAAEDVKDAISEVLADLELRPDDTHKSLIEFMDSLVWDKELCDLESPTIVVRRYVQEKTVEFVQHHSLYEINLANPSFANAVFLMTCYRIVSSLKKKHINKVNEPETVKAVISNTPISKTAAYTFATLACIIVFFSYHAIAVKVFASKSGGGFLPMFILFVVLGWLWKWIVSCSKKK